VISKARRLGYAAGSRRLVGRGELFEAGIHGRNGSALLLAITMLNIFAQAFEIGMMVLKNREIFIISTLKQGSHEVLQLFFGFVPVDCGQRLHSTKR
jgi:hypothetical protein